MTSIGDVTGVLKETYTKADYYARVNESVAGKLGGLANKEMAIAQLLEEYAEDVRGLREDLDRSYDQYGAGVSGLDDAYNLLVGVAKGTEKLKEPIDTFGGVLEEAGKFGEYFAMVSGAIVRQEAMIQDAVTGFEQAAGQTAEMENYIKEHVAMVRAGNVVLSFYMDDTL